MISYDKIFNLTKNLTILCIEDDIPLVKEAKEMLENLFLSVEIAFDGVEGLEKYNTFYKNNNKYYDIVITDISMPRMNGIELISRIYENNEKQLIIVISAHSEPEYLIELVNVGIEHFLIKPYNYEIVLNILYNVSKKLASEHRNRSQKDKNIIELDRGYRWHTKESILFYKDKKLNLTKNELFLMHIFMKNRYKISTKAYILNIAWENNIDISSEKTLKSVISRLRKKIMGLSIENVYSVGYRLVF